MFQAYEYGYEDAGMMAPDNAAIVINFYPMFAATTYTLLVLVVLIIRTSNEFTG